MERAEWLKQMRAKAEALYDHLSPRFLLETEEDAARRRDETHIRHLREFLSRVPPHSVLLSAGCGTGLYDGMLLEAGHSVVGIDFSTGMLAQARKAFPEIRYEKMVMHEMDFRNEFDGIICIDALEHVFPEEWPPIVRGFREALKPGGMLYLTVDVSAADWLDKAYGQARSKGLPVVFGEVVAEVDDAFEKVVAVEPGDASGDVMDKAVYHYYPSVEQVREWLHQEAFTIESEGMGRWYRHFVVRMGQEAQPQRQRL